MSGASTRNKGRRGQTAAANLLRDRDWTVADLSCGIATEDLIAVDPDGKSWACEVKNTMNVMIDHWRQARSQAGKRRMPAMLMNHLHGSRCWLVRRQGMTPTVWEEKE